ncbi:hypothetical protein K426_25244 [Sphingobium sp. TKS]|nr:hypothetical protein K426_25244 [Sphingobium sp. TKS]
MGKWSGQPDPEIAPLGGWRDATASPSGQRRRHPKLAARARHLRNMLIRQRFRARADAPLEALTNAFARASAWPHDDWLSALNLLFLVHWMALARPAARPSAGILFRHRA